MQGRSTSASAPSPSPVPSAVPEEEKEQDSDAEDESSADELDLIDDGHEDPSEDALKASLADGADYMGSDWVPMDLSQVLEALFSEHAMAAASHSGVPKTFADAISRPDGDQYLEAATNEIKALVDNGTFIVRERQPGDRPVGSRWVFLVKRKSDGTIERYKGRVVAQGFSQRPGFDFTETWAPTGRMAAIRAILATAGFEDWDIEQVDISSAFLNGNLEEEITMKVFDGLRQVRPDLFTGGSKNDNDWVLALKKALYGLKQSPRQWHKELVRVMSELGFKKIESDSSIFVFHDPVTDTRVIAPVYVDDITICGKDTAKIAWIKAELGSRFKLRDLGPVEFLLGIRVIRNRPKRTIQLSQRQAIVDILDKFGMTDCAGVGTAMLPGVRLSKDDCPQTDEERMEMQLIPYREAVGSLMYLAIGTRPDIAHSVGVLSRFSSNPGKRHWDAVKHLMRYLKKTMDYMLTYSPSPSKDLFTAYSDADFAGCEDTRCSTSGFVIKMGTGAISWASRLQNIQTLSTTEAEYISAVTCAQEMLLLRNLFTELGFPRDHLPLCIDNQSALQVAKNPQHHGRMKHLDLRYYWLRSTVDEGKISLFYIPTAEMPADVMTKALGRNKLDYARELLGLRL